MSEADADPGTLEELRAHLHVAFPVHSWDADEETLDGPVTFRCHVCAAVVGPYSSEKEGEASLEADSAATYERFREYVRGWAERHRDLAPEGSKFFMLMGCGPDQGADGGRVWREQSFPRQGVWRLDDPPQRGLAEVVLSRQGLAGALTVPMSVLSERLGLRLEQSFVDENDCEIAYLETDQDAFTLVRWPDSEYVEVHAKLSWTGPGLQGVAELKRFLALADLTWDDVHFPPPSGAVSG